ncbi:Methionine--tRNA ligase, mitochondrial [Dirofilaria immitis]|nr:Methionine--tRNA ligase, mitochondrial [Dirofilaria immitis]
MNAVVEALNISPDDDVLELGIGFSDESENSSVKMGGGYRFLDEFQLSQVIPGVLCSYKRVREGKGTVYSVDRWTSLFATVQGRFPKNALENKRIVCDAKLLPFNNEFFDKIFHVHSSYFWTPDLPATLVEIMRVLKPGGVFLSGMHLKKLELLEKGKLVRRLQFDPSRYIFELEPAGFTDVKMEYIKGRTNKEYQLIFAKKPLEIKDSRDPDEVAAYLENKCLYLMIGSIRTLCVIKEISISSMRLKHFITTPIFYANGPPHIGHLYTALLADASNRWRLLKDGNVDSSDSLFTTGTDEHGLKIQRTAIAAGYDPQSYCDNISDKFKDLFHTFNIHPNDFIRTTETRHKEVVNHVWKELNKRGLIQRGKYEGWYSTVDECFYANDEVEKLSGQISTVSKITGSVVEWVEEENYIFPLSKYLGTIRNWLNNYDVIRPKTYFPEALQQASVEGDISLSRDRKRVTWGIAVPNDENQTIYVWFDALMNYLTVSGIFSDKKRINWPPTCQIVGKDILNHWLVNGAKMSKSVGNVIDPFIISKSLSEEGLRYFLLRQGTPQNDANFMMSKAVNVINVDLVNNVGNLLQRSMIGRLNPSQTYPTFCPNSFHNCLLELGEPLMKSINGLAGTVYSLRLKSLWGYAADEWFFQFYEPWKELDDRKISSLLYICYEVLRICGILLQPVIPHYADHLLNRLGIERNERILDNAKFIVDSKYFGKPLGKYNGPVMNRITCKNGEL